jgi:4-hydroxy 2-oxovalerate aldolase
MNRENRKFYDVTLRDGNHALRHSLSPKFIFEYCKIADEADIWAVEVGHGNGIGASSYLVGKSKFSDEDMLTVARESLKNTKLAVHSIPGFSTINKDLIPAVQLGVDIFRIATHVTEADISQKQIEFLVNKEKIVQGVLMMSHMIDLRGLVNQVEKMVSYGVSAVILMDSAGFFSPNDVTNRVQLLKDNFGVEIGFHAHNNLGVAISNALAAAESGASILDGASMGLGAGAGNAQLENIVINYNRVSGIDMSPSRFLELSTLVENSFKDKLPSVNSSSIQSGIAGVFSGYAPQVKEISNELGLDVQTLWNELGKRKLVAGQESMIREIAQDLMNL